MRRSRTEQIVINGSMGEGGGALLRTTLVLSAITQQAVRIHGIRGAMRRKGLTAEDLAFIRAIELSTQAEVQGDSIDSGELLFRPNREARSIHHRVDASAFQEGKVPCGALIFAASLCPLLGRSGAYSTLTFVGETHANQALSYDAFERSTTTAWRQQGLYVFPSIRNSGFGFGTRGEILMDVEPSALTPIEWVVRGDLVRAGATVTTTDMAPEAFERCRAMIASRAAQFGFQFEIDHQPIHGIESGISVTLFGTFQCGTGSATAVLHRGMNVNTAVDRVVEEFKAFIDSKACVDPYLADQMLLNAALTSGKTTYTTASITRRLLTMTWVIKQFLPIKITIQGRENEPGTVTVERN